MQKASKEHGLFGSNYLILTFIMIISNIFVATAYVCTTAVNLQDLPVRSTLVPTIPLKLTILSV